MPVSWPSASSHGPDAQALQERAPGDVLGQLLDGDSGLYPAHIGLAEHQFVEGDVARGAEGDLLNGGCHVDILRDGRPKASLSTSTRHGIARLPLPLGRAGGPGWYDMKRKTGPSAQSSLGYSHRDQTSSRQRWSARHADRLPPDNETRRSGDAEAVQRISAEAYIPAYMAVLGDGPEARDGRLPNAHRKGRGLAFRDWRRADRNCYPGSKYRLHLPDLQHRRQTRFSRKGYGRSFA